MTPSAFAGDVELAMTILNKSGVTSMIALNQEKPAHPFLSREVFGLERQAQTACWGDGFIAELLSSSFGYTRVDESTLSLIEPGFFRLMLIDTASFSPASNQSDAALVRALNRSQTSVVFVESAGDRIRFQKSGASDFEECGLSDLMKTTPSTRDNAVLKTIAVPCISDCYQYPEFKLMIDTLPQYGFSVCASDGHFSFRPSSTMLQLFKNSVKVYPKLLSDDLLALFRKSGFVLLYPSGIRSQTQQLSLALLALFSGSIPVYCGGKVPLAFAEILPHFPDADALARFFADHDNVLLFQKFWLSLLRRILELDQGSRLSLLGEFTPPIWNASPPVAMICVSKRPENLPLILDNFSRQRYSNIKYHIIWNVGLRDKDHCLNAAKEAKFNNLQVSFVDEQYNIGTCLNLGIQSSEAKYWFKIDDDDYYGKYYITDLVNMYRLTGADVVCKPRAFFTFSGDSNLFILHSSSNMLTWLKPNEYACGATLSGRVDKSVPLFSVAHRNSCDWDWLEKVAASECRAFVTDCYNFCNIRYGVDHHTSKLPTDWLLDNASSLGHFDETWVDAD